MGYGFQFVACLGVAIVILSNNYEVVGDLMEKCVPRNGTYKIGDSEQCDMFHECAPNGKTIERLCPDGLVFAPSYEQCDYPVKVDCTARSKLQPSQSTNPLCARSYGIYPFPAAESCQKFYHCEEGKINEKTCPEGIIFDTEKLACVHPDQSNRKDCSASVVNNFKCPNAASKFSKLKFGDHDRHAHPSDCRKFYICFQDGRPRLGGCPEKTVFNPKNGYCSNPKKVPDCSDYYERTQGQNENSYEEVEEKFGGEDDHSDEEDELSTKIGKGKLTKKP